MTCALSLGHASKAISIYRAMDETSKAAPETQYQRYKAGLRLKDPDIGKLEDTSSSGYIYLR